MPVGVQGRLRRAVPEPMLDDLHVEAVTDEQRRQVVPEIVEAELLRQPGHLRPGSSDRPFDRPGRGLPLVAVRDHEVAAPPGPPPQTARAPTRTGSVAASGWSRTSTARRPAAARA